MRLRLCDSHSLSSVKLVRLFLIALLLESAALSAAPLPDASAAAKRPGEYLTFEDTVKAVSKSRTRVAAI